MQARTPLREVGTEASASSCTLSGRASPSSTALSS